MFTKSLSIILFILFFIVGTSSCTKSDQDGNKKVLNLAVNAKVKGLDPISANDTYSSNEVGRVYEGLLQYHYLKRPFQLEPDLAEAMPEISKDGLIYTFKIKKGVLFQDSECFPNGKGRELTAHDFVYSLKRLADPKLHALGWWLVDGKIAGLNEWRTKYTGAKEVNYSDEIEGLKAVDKYTLSFKLTKPYPQFLYSLAMSYTVAVPKEAVEFYGKDFVNHAVGTGPFILTSFNPQSRRIVYERNPTYREVYYPSEGSEEFKKRGYLKDAGKRLPLVDKVVVNVMVESQPRWLQFKKGKLDFIGIPKDNFDSVIIPGKGLIGEFQKKGISLDVTPSIDITYIAFNLDNKIFKNKKLRQAISLAYDRKGSNKLFYNNKGVLASTIIPPGLAGHDEKFKNPYGELNLELAKQYLVEAGYPGGRGLEEIVFETTSATTSRQMGEFFKKGVERIGVRLKVVTNTWPELQKKVNSRRAMIWGMAWLADYPDAENFLQLLYGGNRSPGPNGSGYNNTEYNALYEKVSVMHDSPERTKLYEKMSKMAVEDVPLLTHIHRLNYSIYHGWLQNYVASDFSNGRAKYLNIDLKKKKETEL